MLTTLLSSVLLAGGVEIIHEDAKIVAADESQYGGFGGQVAMSGDTAVVGSSGNDAFGIDSGAAWILERDQDGQWVQTQFFAGDNTSMLDNFGYAVALHDDLLVIGARFKMIDNMVNCGAVHVFERQGDGQFAQVQMITPPTAMLDMAFGSSVDTDGSRIVVGARYGNDGAGGAWVYALNDDGEWALEGELSGSGIDDGDRFGRTVSVLGDRIACGAPWFGAGCSGTNECGTVFMFEYDGADWVETDQIVPDDLANQDYFGYIVDLGEDRLLVSSVYDDDNAPQTGSGYVFDLEGGQWAQTYKMVAPDGQWNDLMGMSAQMSGDTVALGGWYGNDGRGAVWTWRLGDGGWSFLAEAQASDGAEYDIFGGSVALEGDTLLVGAYWADIGDTADAGAVYVYDLAMEEASGACCTNNTCVESTQSLCEYFGGVFQGDGSDCGGSDCDSCSADIDGDGAVTVDDLLMVISQFGPCI
ncbi:MAG: FG-GAP repeat protein [Phycisphaerales bacterium]|nr:FG-GAP repeat protein [Phycisphaerales bacterium]